MVRRIVLWLVLPGLGLAAGIYFLSPLAAKTAVNLGGRQLGAGVQVESVGFGNGMWLGHEPAVIELNGLSLANPVGFESPVFMAIRKLTLHVDLDSLTGHTVLITSAVLDGVLLNLERNNLITNAGVVLGQISDLHAKSAVLWAPEVRFAVQRIEVRNAVAWISYAPKLGHRGRIAVRLDRRQLPGVGEAPNGVEGTVVLYHAVEGVVMSVIEQVLKREHARAERLR